MRISILPAGRVVRRALLATASLLAGLSAHAQAPTNDDPCGAVTLSPQGSLCTAPTVSTNLNATTTVPNGYTNSGNPLDVWFKFTTTATGPASFGATITVNGNPATFVQLFSGAACAGPLAPLAFSSSNQANTTAPRLITGALQPSTTYYVRVSGNASFNDAAGPFTICVSDGPGTATCGSPSAGPFVSTGPTTGTLAFTAGVNNVAPFVFTIRDVTAQSSFGSFNASASPLALTGLTPGHSYSVTVAANCSTGGQGSSQFPYTFNLPVANDEPCGAIVLPVGTTCVPTAADNTNATSSSVTTNGPANCANTPGSHDVWFTFTTAASGTGSTGVTIQNGGQSSAAGTMRVYRAASCSGGAFTQLGCSTNTFITSGGAAAPLVVSGLAPGTTYYVRVDEGGAFNRGQAGPFTICVIGAVGCAAPSNFFSGIKTDTTAPLYFTPGNNNQNYTITYTAQGGTPQTVSASTSPFTLTGLLPGTFYTVSLVANCGGGQTSSPVTITFATAIANDEPCGAIAIPLNTGSTCQATSYGSVLGATSTVAYGYTSTGCGTIFSDPNDVWFSFATPTTGTASTAVSLALAGTGKQLRVFSAASCAGPFTEVGCSGVSAGVSTPPVLTLRTLTPGTTYFVRVAQAGGNNSATATFTLCLTPAPSCAAPTGLSVSTTSATESSLTFAAGFGAGSYTVTYQTPGGPVQTVTPAPTTSPVALTGLVAGQAYTVTLVSDCGAGQTSAPATITFVAGGCASRAYAVLPLTETFEPTWLSVCDIRDTPNASWRTTPATGANSWRRDDDGDAANWTASDLGTYTPTGAQGSAHSARFHSMYVGTLPPGSLDLFVNLSPAGSKRLTFDYTNTQGNDSLKVLLSLDGGATFSRLLRLGIQPTFTAQVVDFPASSATAVIRFIAQAGTVVGGQGNSTDIGIDNVQVLLSPACASPLLSLLASTATTASIGLAGGNGATTYTVTYQALGGALQTVSPAPSASPVSLSGMLPATTYTVTAVSNCAGGTTSTPPSTLTFTTPAVTIGNDECSTATPITALGSGGCAALTIANNGAATTSVQVAACGTPVADIWYSVTVPTNGIVEATTSAAPGSPVSDTVLELLTGTCGSLTSVGCNDDGNGLFSHVRATGLTPGATVYIRIWTYDTTPRGDIGLCVQTDAACPPVTLLRATVTGTTASIAFTGPAAASGYTVTYTPTGGTATTVTTAASPVSITGLLPFTSYTVTVTSNCAGSLTSIPATVVFSTSTYCTTGIGGSCGGNNIVAVAIPATTLSNLGTTCTTTAGNAYTSYPAAGSTTASLAQGRTYQFSVTTDGTSDITAWIDFNQDGVFAASEGTQVILGGAANLPALASFTVPATAAVGRTGMRVRSRGAGNGNGPADACTGFGGGETEDYLVTITLATAVHESALAAQVGLFPNPATDAFTLTLPAALSNKATIVGLYNSLGQLVRQQVLPASATGSETRFDVRGLAAGVYAVRLTTPAGLVVKRVVLD